MRIAECIAHYLTVGLALGLVSTPFLMLIGGLLGWQ